MIRSIVALATFAMLATGCNRNQGTLRPIGIDSVRQ